MYACGKIGTYKSCIPGGFIILPVICKRTENDFVQVQLYVNIQSQSYLVIVAETKVSVGCTQNHNVTVLDVVCHLRGVCVCVCMCVCVHVALIIFILPCLSKLNLRYLA